GVVPAHNVSLDLKNPDNVFRDAWRARTEFGCLRMWSIHPAQIQPIVDAMKPDLREVADASAILVAAQRAHRGPLPYQGDLHDLGISNLDDVLTDVRRITDVCDLPLLVDADTGFGASAFNVARTVKSLIKFGAAAMHIEDQVGAKRCGHRPGKELVSREEMID